MTVEMKVREEVVRLHRFFDAWFEGKDGLRIEEFTHAMDPLFTIVTPDGQVLDREAILATVQGAYGRGGIGITVQNLDVVEREGYVVCRYDEVHETDGATTTRLSTAVMESDPETPGGYRWVTVHETWAPP